MINPPNDEEKLYYIANCEDGQSHLRALRFDDAKESFRQAYKLFPDRPDSLWGLICAEYGIVQVESYHDHKKTAVFCQVNYLDREIFSNHESVRELKKLIAGRCEHYAFYDAWLRDAEDQIQRIRNATPGRYTPWKWDVFIACKISNATERFPKALGKTPEHAEALKLYDELTAKGLRVFYSEKYFVQNMGKPDSDWQILTALLNSRQMLLVCGGINNEEKLNTPWVRSEWMRWRNMQRQKVKDGASMLVYSISDKACNLPAAMDYTGNTAYPSHRAELLRTLERNCYTDGQYDRDLQKGQELLSRSDFSEASRVFTHTAYMRPDCAEPHVYLFLCDLRVTRVSGLSEKHIEGSLESNPHYREAEARNNRAFCELFHDLKGRIQFLRDRQKDDKMAKMQEKMEELERQLQERTKKPEHQPQEKTEKTEREERDKKEPPAPIPIQTVRYSQGLKFEKLEDGTYAVKGIGICKDTELVIPPTTPEGGRVTAIGERAFYDCGFQTSIAIPDSVTEIGDYAFQACVSLTSVTIPDSVTTIGKEAFCECDSLTSVTIPDSVTTIEESAFWRCDSLTSVTIPDSVTEIGNYAFQWCRSLTSITIPDSVTAIGAEAFSECDRLTSITIPDSVTAIGKEAFKACPNAKIYCAHPSKPSDWHDNWNPDNHPVVWNHKPGASAPAIKTPPQTVRYSQGLEFKKLAKDTYAVKGIGTCKDTELVIPPTTPEGGRVTAIGELAFEKCYDLTSVTIPDSVTTIGSSAFKECRGLTSITIPDSVTTIGRWAFSRCSSLTSITIPDSVTTIGGWAFSGCDSLTSVTIPDSVTTIEESAFRWCESLTSVTIPDSVTTIGVSAFCGCSSLTSIIIPDSVTTIGEGVFRACPNAKIYCAHPSKPSGWNTDWNPDNRPVVWNHKPGASAPAIKTPPQTVRYSQGLEFKKLADGTYAVKGIGTCKDTELVIPPTTPEGGRVTAIGEWAFFGCSLISVTIPDSVTTIGRWAFYECSNLTSVTIPDSVTTIGEEAFSKCVNLTSINIPNNVTAIGERAFMGCSNLTSITIPDSVTAIGWGAFWRCDSLTSVNIPRGVENLGRASFARCKSLRTITVDPSNKKYYSQDNCVIDKNSGKLIVGIQMSRIPNGVTAIGERAFMGCSNLTSITIPDSVTTIGKEAFYECDSLTSITIPDSVTAIGEWAFWGCDSLTSVNIPRGVENLGRASFARCKSLRTITVDPSNKKYYSQDNCVIDKNSGKLIVGIQTSRIPNGVTTIGEYAFSDCSNLTSITIPDSVTTIGEYAFRDCSNLTSVTIPDSVTAIRKGVFKACPNVTINCAHPSKPSGWNDDWNPDNRPVVWKNKLKSFFSRLRSN